MGAALKDVLILGVKVTGLKGTCHFIRMRHSIREMRLRGCGYIPSGQIGKRDLPAVSAGNAPWRGFAA